MADKNTSPEIKLRLRRFWSATIFALGLLWGFANLVYIPIVVLTSVRGGSLAEVLLIVCGGLLLFLASIRAFFDRRQASRILLLGGFVLLVAALLLPFIPAARTSGLDNRILTLSSSIIALALGCFGSLTQARGWPSLRALPAHSSPLKKESAR